MPRRHPLRVVGLVVLLSVIATTPGVVAQTQQRVDETRRELEQAKDDRAFVLSELNSAVAEYQLVNAELADLTFRITQLYDRIQSYESNARDLRDEAVQRAIDAYMAGGAANLDMFFEAEDFNELITSREVLERAAEKDVEIADQLTATQQEMERLREVLAEDQARVDELRIQAEALVERLDVLYADADADVTDADTAYRDAVRELEAERTRQRLAALAALQGAAAGVPLAATPGFICPVSGGASFINDWGFPRSGGRRHKGTDMFNARGTPLVAVANGSVRLTTSSLGGIGVWLTADYGSAFYYAHLDGYPAGLGTGQRVAVGQAVGYVGDSGNARGGAPHLHFQIHPGGGAPVNPYPTVAAVC